MGLSEGGERGWWEGVCPIDVLAQEHTACEPDPDVLQGCLLHTCDWAAVPSGL